MIDAFGWYAGAVVFHHAEYAGATLRRDRHGARREQHAMARPLERVLEQIAEQLHEIALLAVETRAAVDVELAQHVLVGIDLFERAHDFLGAGLERQRHRKGLSSTGR